MIDLKTVMGMAIGYMLALLTQWLTHSWKQRSEYEETYRKSAAAVIIRTGAARAAATDYLVEILKFRRGKRVIEPDDAAIMDALGAMREATANWRLLDRSESREEMVSQMETLLLLLLDCASSDDNVINYELGGPRDRGIRDLLNEFSKSARDELTPAKRLRWSDIARRLGRPKP